MSIKRTLLFGAVLTAMFIVPAAAQHNNCRNIEEIALGILNNHPDAVGRMMSADEFNALKIGTQLRGGNQAIWFERADTDMAYVAILFNGCQIGGREFNKVWLRQLLGFDLI